MHPRNRYQGKYPMNELKKLVPDLAQYIRKNPKGENTLDFANPVAVRLLNEALLKQYYQLTFWEIPEDYLCPPIPGRADYIHIIADILKETSLTDSIPKGDHIKGFDIGTGANLIYPILGNREYGWQFVGSEIDKKALKSAQKIIDKNECFKNRLELRLQPNPRDLFRSIIKEGEQFDFSLCNPPFHASATEAREANERKQSNLKGKTVSESILNFGGKNTELWYEGGEAKFIQNMAFQSKFFKESCLWFSTLVSKKENLKGLNKTLKKVEVAEIKTVPMGQGNKKSRMVVWTFLNEEQRNEWTQKRWKK